MAEVEQDPSGRMPPQPSRPTPDRQALPANLDAAVGSVAQEAALLLRALREHGEAASPGARTASAPAAAAAPGLSAVPPPPKPHDHDHDHDQHDHQPHDHETPAPGSTCTWCPLCRTVDMVRSLSPETLERLADLATVAATAVAELAVQARRGQAAEPPNPPPAPPPRPAAQTVPVTDDPEEDA